MAATNFHSLEYGNKVSGPVTFTEDGRLELTLVNTEEASIVAEFYVLPKAALKKLLGDNIFAEIADRMLSVFTLSPKHKVGEVKIIVPPGGFSSHFVTAPLQ